MIIMFYVYYCDNHRLLRESRGKDVVVDSIKYYKFTSDKTNSKLLYNHKKIQILLYGPLTIKRNDLIKR